MCAEKQTALLQLLPMCSEQEMESYVFPEDYAHDVVADGYTGKKEDGSPTTWLTKLHVVKSNGRLACDCKVVPGKVWVYTSVLTPSDWYDILCESSALYLRQEIYRLENAGQPAGG